MAWTEKMQASGGGAAGRAPPAEETHGPSREAKASLAPPAANAPATASVAHDCNRSELSRLFIVCGRDRKVDELRALFSACGPIKHLHLALDRSKNSRGFAFLQYEDPANAAAAIAKLDRLKLDDGHVLKVTIAKEKPAGGKGKLKRSQHARQDPDEKEGNDIRREADGGLDARLPGKRQRSSPPAAALPSALCRSPASALLSCCRLDEHNVGVSTSMPLVKQEPQADPTLSVGLPTEDSVNDALRQVEMVLKDMLGALEQQRRGQNSSAQDLDAAYNRVKRENVEGRSRAVELMIKCEPPNFGFGSEAHAKQQTRDEEGETSTDLLASSIGSVSLTSTPMASRRALLDAARGQVATKESAGARSGKQHLRRRRQSVDDSGSSTEDGSDGSGSRRKRSNTTTSPPPTLQPRARTAHPLWSPPKLSDKIDRSFSPEGPGPETIVKKPCKRQSSDNLIENSYRLAKQQATHASRERERDLRSVPDSRAATNQSAVKLEAEPALMRTKLFFTSTYKFTQQEVEAMFAVYGDFKSVELVKSFGRVKTMAYVRYSKPTTAAAVVKSFRDESVQDADDPEKNEFMTLSFAHDSSALQPLTSQQAKLAGSHPQDVQYPPSPNSRPNSHLNANAPSSDPGALTTAGHERLWILLLYDRFLATHMLSSVVSSYTGMEFMDIKVVKSTGEAQGVAFVKFESEESATQAALQLHQMELPLGSGKYLQAIVIMAPSLFTTTHGVNGAAGNDEPMDLHRTTGERVVTGSSEDVDLRAVEARFAHLMRNNESQRPREAYYPVQYPPLPPSGARTSGLETQSSPVAATGYTQAAQANPTGYHSPVGSSTGFEYYPMQFVAYPAPQQQFQSYAAGYGPSGGYQQQQQAFGAAVPTWMDNTPYYQGGVPQYPFSYMPHQQVVYPVARVDSIEGNNAVTTGNESAAAPSKSRGSSSPAEQMDTEDSASSCGSTALSTSIYVSSSHPLELMALVDALHGCDGVVAFTKDTTMGPDGAAYVVDFGKEAQAAEAARALDGSMCDGQKLRVTTARSTRPRGGGGKPRSGSGRRKRQRVDLRSRK